MKNLYSTIKKVIFVAIIAVLSSVGVYKCPFKMIFGTDCPGCGMTRAFISALHLNFKEAFNFHPLFLLFGLELIYVVFSDLLSSVFKINKKAELTVGIISLVLLLIVWIIKQFVIKI